MAAKDTEEAAPEYGYGGADGEANKLAFLKAYDLPIIYRDDGTLDMQAASRASAAKPSSGIQVFGGVGGLAPTVDNPTEVVDTDFAGGMPDIITDIIDDAEEDPFVPPTAPQPDGDGSFVEGGPPVDTSWDWSFFKDKAPGDSEWGGYDEDYQAFERYQPGEDSAWGMPNIEGGNEDFYQQQFANLLRADQGYQNRARDARGERQYSLDNPAEALPMDWSWANAGEGLKEVTLGTGLPAGEGEWSLSSGAPGDTNSALFAGLGDIWNANESDAWAESFASDSVGGAGNTLSDSQYWSSFDNPADFMEAFKADNPEATGAWTDINQKLANNLFTQGATTGSGANIPVGYAAPV